MKRCLAPSILVALATQLYSGSARAEHVVLLSETTQFTVGQILDDPLTLSLKSGERIVLLSDRGDLMDIAGPFEGSPTATGGNDFNVRDALAKLIDNPNNLHASLGSTRGGSGVLSTAASGPVWSIDPFASGVQCAIEGQAPEFGRSSGENVLVLHVQRPGHDGTGAVRFDSNGTRAEWPDNIPVTHGELYVVKREGHLDSAMFRLILLPERVAENLDASVAWLAANGCTRQATLLLKERPD